ncbi:MAG: hypothetical protein HY738_24475 [Bacteroidia bacterium]|nr:hypothetical protein [Bacteroidia bacterium]
MPGLQNIQAQLTDAFTPLQSNVLAKVIYDSYNELIKTSDFNELKNIVSELAVAQRSTEKRMDELAVAQRNTEKRIDELAVAQRNTEKRKDELVVAQKNTEKELTLLTINVSKLSEKVHDNSVAIGGIGRTMGYWFENEVYRLLPCFLKDNYGIVVTKRFLRRKLKTGEVNLFGKGKKGGEEIVIIGEVKQRLEGINDVKEAIAQLENAEKVLSKEIEKNKTFRIIITHLAVSSAITYAKKNNTCIIQSFEL